MWNIFYVVFKILSHAHHIMSSSSSESESSESSSSSREGGEEEEEDQAARLVRAAVRATSEVLFYFFIIRVFFVFPSSLCFCVSKRSAKLSLSLTLSLIGRGLWMIIRTARNALKRRVSTVHVVPVHKFMVQEVTSHPREFQVVGIFRGIERFRGVCFNWFSIEMVDRKSSAKVVGTRR